MARAIATRCCCPPESCDGRCSSRDAEARRARAPSRARSRALLAPDPGVDERQLDVLDGARAREQVEALKDEADGPVAHLGELAAAEARDLADRRGRSCRCVGRSRQPRTFMSVDLPEPDGAHDGDELAAVDGQAHAVERVQLGVAEDVGLAQVLGHDERRARRSNRSRATPHGSCDAHPRRPPP